VRSVTLAPSMGLAPFRRFISQGVSTMLRRRLLRIYASKQGVCSNIIKIGKALEEIC